MTGQVASALVNDPVAVGGAVVQGLAYNIGHAIAHPFATATDIKDGLIAGAQNTGQGTAAVIDPASRDRLNDLYGQDITPVTETLAGAQAISAVAGTVGVGKTIIVGSQLAKNIAGQIVVQTGKQWIPLAGKALDDFLDRYAQQALLDSGGVWATNGTPLLDFRALTNDQKRVVGELFGENRVQKLLPDGEKLARIQSAGINGIDDLYKVNRPDVDYVVIEYKYGTSRLQQTRDGLQMSDGWLTGANTADNRILKSVNDAQIAKSITYSLRKNRVERWLVHTDPSGGVAIGLLDKNGKFIPRQDMTSKILGAQK